MHERPRALCNRALFNGLIAAVLIAWPRPSAGTTSVGATSADATSAGTTCAVPALHEHFRNLPPVPSDPMVRTRSGPPEDPGLGDSWLWYTWDQTGFPVAEQKLCTVRGVGENAYIVVENSQWLTNVNQADVDRMLLMWDHESLGEFSTQGFHEIDTAHFGPIPDALDNDPKVFVLLYNFPFPALGFVWPYDQFPDGTQPFASNECETLYIDSATLDPGSDYMLSVQAHELAHLIHLGGDANEVEWVDEGFGELAMTLFGVPDGISGFPTNPDNNLVNWAFDAANYAKVHLWMLYFFEHFGGRESILHLVDENANSITGVSNTLTARGYTTTFAELIRDWTIANWLDDATLGAQYEYVSEDFAPFLAAATHSTYPVPAMNAQVNHWAADYVRLVNGEPQRIFFDGDDSSAWAVSAISFSAGVPSALEFMSLNAVDQGSFDLLDLGPVHDEVVLVITNVSSNGGLSYLYSTAPYSTDVPSGPSADASLAPGAMQLASRGAHPAIGGDTRLALRLGAAGPVHVDVFAVDGSLVRRLHDGVLPPGESDLAWDGRDSSGRFVAAGSYWVRANGANGNATLRVVRIR